MGRNLFEEGRIINGTWEIERKLGEGAFAQVYRVRHQFLGRQAMKVFKTVGLTMDKMRQMLSEAGLLSSLSHPNIIRMFEANITETAAGMCGFFTMDLVAGGSLDDFWKKHENQFVPIPDTVEIGRQICRGLALAHKQSPPIIHRDIKPQNVLVGYGADGLHVRVSDFGLAKQVNPLTLMATAVGTPAFKAPEVWKEKRQDSAMGDVFSVGVTLYLLLTDKFPYTHEQKDLEDSDRFRRVPFVTPSRLNVRVDSALDAILARCLAIHPKERYPSAVELLADLERWSPATRPVKPTSRFSTPDQFKSALGAHSPANQEEAEQMVREAIDLASAGQFGQAVNKLEEALNAWPALRNKYEGRIKAWHRGVVR